MEQVLSWMPQLLDGLRVTLAVTGLSLLFGLPLGVVLAFGMLSRTKLLKWLSVGIVEFGRGVPLLVLLYLLYFGLPGVGVVWSAFLTAVVAIAFSTGAYTSEIFRAGILSVPGGHVEAAHALGFTHADETRFIVLPQAFRAVLGPIISYSIIIFQATSLGYAISLPELLNQSYQIASINMQYLGVFTVAGLIYAFVSIIVSQLVNLIERRSQRAFSLAS